MKILFMLAVIYIALFVVSVLLKCVSIKKWTSKDSKYLLFFEICLIFVSFFAVPSVSDDLYRWYANVNWYRLGKPLFRDFSGVVMPIQTNAIFIFNLSMQLVSKMNNNGYLQVVWLIVNFGGLYITWTHFVNKYKPEKRYMYTYLLMYFAMTPFFYSLSGMRYNAVASLLFWGIYFVIFERKRNTIYILFIFSLFVHQSVVMIMMIYVFFAIGKHFKLYRFIVFWTLLVDIMISIVNVLPGEIFKLLGYKIYYYFNEHSYSMDGRLKIVLSIIVVLLLFSIYKLKNKFICLGREFVEYSCFIECMLLFCLGTYFNDTIFLRGIHLLGYCLLPYNYMILRLCRKVQRVIFVEIFLAIGLNLYYLVTLFTYIRFIV